MHKNVLYYGDNLDILPRYVADESVDLIYLDPPFNSNQSYNVLFSEHNGSDSQSQIKAFEDTWHWDQAAAKAYQDIVEGGGRMSEAMQSFYKLLGPTDMNAYLTMMAPRLLELRRVLKPTGSVYLHCDPTAGHYLKIVMDAVFGPKNFRNEVVWKRTSARSDSHKWNRIHDTLLFYSKSDDYTWHTQYIPYDEGYVKKFYRHVEAGTGRRYTLSDLMARGLRKGSSGKPWRGIDPGARGNHWKNKVETLEELDAQGRIYWPAKKGGVPRYKRYLDEMPGLAIQSIIMDIPPLSAQSAEKLGYPTQKPQALLERIVSASSNEGDTVLDPFCGCGTTVVAAQKLRRRWIGIDVTHLAITLIKHRLHTAFGDDLRYEVIGEPTSVADAKELAQEDPYQFQLWALGLVDARPVEQKKGADRGIDGRLYFHDEPTGGKTKQIILQVKGGRAKPSDVRDLRGVVEREKAEIGVLICMQKPTRAMRTEAAEASFYKSPWRQKPYPKLQILTVADLLTGRGIDYPPRKQTNVTFRKAPKANRRSSRKRSNPDLFGQ